MKDLSEIGLTEKKEKTQNKTSVKRPKSVGPPDLKTLDPKKYVGSADNVSLADMAK